MLSLSKMVELLSFQLPPPSHTHAAWHAYLKGKRNQSLTVQNRTLLWRQKQNPDLLQRNKEQPESNRANCRAPLESLEIAERRHHHQMSLSQSFLSCCVELSNKSVPITARGVWPAPRADQKRVWQGGLTWSRVSWALLLLLERGQCEGLGHVKEVVVRSWIFSTICNWSRLTCFSTDAGYGEWFIDGA